MSSPMSSPMSSRPTSPMSASAPVVLSQPSSPSPSPSPSVQPKISARNISVFYGGHQALKSINLDIPAQSITSFIGPSGCGKSTFLRCFNRMNDVIPHCRVEGEIRMGDIDINDPSNDPVLIRARVGMVFQKPNPFPKSIYDNVIYGPRIHGMVANKAESDAMVADSLKRAGLWDEVHHRLHDQATGLSGGQQQRLCIARAIAISPEVLLMDEPCSSLDPIATSVIEELMHELQENYTIIIITHSMQQAARVSQNTAYFHLGHLIEFGDTKQIFTRPTHDQTEAYISGKIG